jgi:hypothetical protein
MDKKEKNIKYDYSNPESQKLFEEFTVLLADVTRHMEDRGEYIPYIPPKLFNFAKRLKNKLRDLFK